MPLNELRWTTLPTVGGVKEELESRDCSSKLAISLDIEIVRAAPL
jgi:hypothetical protein